MRPRATSSRTSKQSGWLPALALGLVLVGCGGVQPTATAGNYDATRELFVAGMTDIDAVFIDKVALDSLAEAGLERLSKLDGSVALRREGDRFELVIGGKQTALFDSPESGTPEGWGELMADYIVAAQNASTKIRAAEQETIYQTVFEGIVTKLDRFSRYASAAKAADNRALREGFGGIGVRISLEDGNVRVVSVTPYSPAQRSGLRIDDIITHVDGQPIAGLAQEEVISLLRGPVDSRVSVTIQRRNDPSPFGFTLTRAHIVAETVTYAREGDAAYFHIVGFNADTAKNLQRAIADAQREIGGKLDGYILDLRDNPGGLLDQAVAVADLFVESGRISSTHGRHPDSHQYFEASAGDVAGGKPIVLLVNANSASAAEIVAAALQDRGRGVVIGSNSYGKGTVQSVLPLPNRGELLLTWARFHAPSGYTLNELGVLPSICTSDHRGTLRALVNDLARDRIDPVPIAVRNATAPDDEPALRALRDHCPQQAGLESLDLELAARLLDEPALYEKAISLADATSLAEADPAPTPAP